MGRKKKNQKEIEIEEEKEGQFHFDIHSDAKRGVVAIFLFTLSLVVTLGFFGKAGILGNYLDLAVGVSIGWTKFIFPIFLVMAGVVLILRKETSFYVSKLFGLGIVFLSLAGFFHWFYAISEMLAMAKAGNGGGYVGYLIAHTMAKYLGGAGSFVVLLALFLIGVIVAFNFSIIHFLLNLKEKLAKKEVLEEKEEMESEGVEEIETIEEVIAEESVSEEKSSEGESSDEDAKNNIRKIEFVEGPDQFVDPVFSQELDLAEEDSKRKKKKLGKLSQQKWILPPTSLLEESIGTAKGGDTESNAKIIEDTLRNFGIIVERDEIRTGPSVTQYSFRPAVGVKISKILSLQDDLALALAKHPIRIEAPIPGKSLIGIEAPNTSSSMVRLRGILESQNFKLRKSDLTLALGQDVQGNYIFGNLDKMPHLMIAGATGTGKSVGINSIITALLYQNSPEDLKLILVDPKRVELSMYSGIPHLLTPVVVENSKVVNVLNWAVKEMERRYKTLQEAGSRDIVSYKQKVAEGEKRSVVNLETNETTEEDLVDFPYIVIIIDELADLMGSHGKEVEGLIVRLAQMARAVGIHLIVSTQRPSVEVITGLIKANITTRVAFQVATQIDSRTILDMAGAEKLLGNGDMLYLSSSSPKPKRIQGVYVDEKEVKKVVDFLVDQKEKRKSDGSMEEEIGEDISGKKQASEAEKGDEILNFGNSKEAENGDDDLMYERAKEEVIKSKKASASLLQRRLRVGYARAARLLDILEDRGIIGPSKGAKPRDIYVDEAGEISYSDSQTDQEVRDKWEM